METAEASLAETAVATALRNAYAEQMKKFGVAYLESNEFDPMGALTEKKPADWSLWIRLAKKVVRAELNPAAFIDAQFVACANGRGLQPKTLVDEFKTARNRYWQQVPRTDVEFHRRGFGVMQRQLVVLEAQLIPRCCSNRNELLLNPVLSFTSWFRVLLADRSLPTFALLLEHYGEEAQTQYQTDSGLRNFLEEKKDAYPVSRCWCDL